MATDKADPRAWIKVAVDLPFNPKLISYERPGEVIGLLVTSWALSAQGLKDGHFSPAAALRFAGAPKEAMDHLIEVGAWHLAGHDCERCPQPKTGEAYAHDYLAHQRSAADQARYSQAGRKAAYARHANRSANRTTNRSAGRSAEGSVEGSTEPQSGQDEVPPPRSTPRRDQAPDQGVLPFPCEPHANRNAEKSREEEKRKPRALRAHVHDADFDLFWKVYPRKVRPDAARKAWAKAITRASVEEILAGAKRYAEDPNLPEKTYRPHPATWLNAGGWADEPEPPRDRGRRGLDDEIQGAVALGEQIYRERLERERTGSLDALGQDPYEGSEDWLPGGAGEDPELG